MAKKKGPSQFVPLTTALIDEGEFIKEIDSELTALQVAHMRFVHKHGEKAYKSVAKMKIELVSRCELVDVDNGNHQFSVKTAIKSEVPKRPVSVSFAMCGEDQTGDPCMLVRTSGSDQNDPRQGKLFTNDGRRIDPETGEPIDE